MLPGIASAIAGKNESATQVVTFIGTMALTGTTNTDSFDIGGSHSRKEIFIVATSARNTGARTLTAASTTVDGVAVTKSATEPVFSTDYSCHCAFAATPTSAGVVSITLTFSGSVDSGRAAIYAVYNRTGSGNSSDSDSSGTASGTSVNVNATTIPANGVWFGAHRHNNANATTSPATEDYDSSGIALCSRDFSAGSTPSDTWSWSGAVVGFATSWSYA